MDLVAADSADEEFLLDLLNTTPVVDGEAARRSRAAEVGPGMDAQPRHRADRRGTERR